MINKRGTSLIEMFLIISMSFSFAYIIHESEGKVKFVTEENNLEKIYAKLLRLLISDKNFVSAAAAVYTCVKAKDGSICQEYPVFDAEDAAACNELCDGSCIPSGRDKVAECKIGTCYDELEGTCQAGSPKKECENFEGKWFPDPFENIPQCREGCCVLGDQTQFVSDRQCGRQAELLGLEKEFKPEIRTEIQCLILAKSQEEGACVFQEEFENTCKFTTKAQCLSIGGEFKVGLLCSNSDLDTNCERQASANCVEGKDELYWFDSCGNKENIYDANKGKSWNDGKVLGKADSCSIGTETNGLKNQNTCGNCNYIMGSICGEKTANEKLSDGSIDYVCRDLSCTDKDGQKRVNGESWCEYQGSIGTDKGSGNKLRATDTPGSRHFRQVCLDAEIRTEACADYRNEICVEEQTKKAGGGEFSSAACRLNRWQQCLEYNTNVKNNQKSKEKRDDKCTQNPDCFVKEVNIADNFKFNICAPKYPAGFDLRTNGETAEGVCSIASQKCTVIYVKKETGSWQCVANCDCEEGKFTEQMNDLCMSLGDCGLSVNYNGDLGEGYKVHGAPKLSKSYIAGISKYSDVKKGKVAEPGNLKDFYGALGIPGGLGSAKTPEDASKAATMMGLLTAGMVGIPVLAAAYFGVAGLSGIGITSGLGAASGEAVTFFGGGSASPALGAMGGVLAGGAIGLAATSLLIKFTGIGPGLSPMTTYALLGAGAIGGAIVGYAAVTPGIGAGGGLFAGATILGPILIIAVVLIIVWFKLMGVGKTKQVIVDFSCQPWQAPRGGKNCEECGKDGLPCSRYTCQSLGQTCEFENEGTGEELCINISPNDVTSPRISPLEIVLADGFEYSDVSENGYKIKSNVEDGCVKAYQPLTFGISLNEPGQCRFDTLHTNTFEEMEFDFGGRNLYLWNHTQTLNIPSLESLGIPGYDPNRRADYSLYVRCADGTGNENINEYVINFCVKPGDDITAPLITKKEPLGEYTTYNATEQQVTIWTNEPSECKWDSTDKTYDSMLNEFECANDVANQEFYGFKCEGTLGITTEENKYYVRCKDQPWLSGTDKEGDRNTNSESYQVNLKRSRTNLKIDSISPNNRTISAGVEPVSVEVIVRTSGGVDGNAICKYGIGNNLIEFYDTLGNEHRQVFQSFTAGEKELPIVCEDEAGNIASQTAEFNILIDTSAPEISRVYNTGNLIVITNEPSECSFITGESKKKDLCNFEFINGTLMSGVDLVHSSEFDSGKTHYIKCKDRFDNAPGACSIILKGGA